MKLCMCSIFDGKAKAFTSPLFFVTPEVAIRNFAYTVQESRDSMMFKFPEDFVLYHLGEWDDQMGVVRMFEPMRQLAVGVAVSKRGEPDA